MNVTRTKNPPRLTRRGPRRASAAAGPPAAARLQLHVFETELGWMAALGRDDALVQLTIGNDSPRVAVDRLKAEWRDGADLTRWCAKLMRRLRAFAAGSTVDFADIPVEHDRLTAFQVRVLERCRRIAWGETLSYGELARLAGCPGAARAVGNVMAGNRCPLIIPCHRVVHADGRIGRFSAPQGSRMKRRLLALEDVTR